MRSNKVFLVTFGFIDMDMDEDLFTSEYITKIILRAVLAFFNILYEILV